MENEKIVPFSFNSYEKISDDIYFLSKEAILKFSVILGRKNRDGTKKSFHNEYVYPSKYLDMTNSITIKRSYDFFLSIEMLGDQKSADNSVRIKPKDMIFLQTQLGESIKWFNTIFRRTKGGNVIIKGEFNNIKIPLSYDKFIELEPTIIIDYEDNKKKREGIRMYMSSHDVYTDIDIDTYFGFIYIINTFNMYQAASTMLAYLNKNTLGNNIMVFNEAEDFLNNDLTDINSASINRKGIEKLNRTKAGKSFFDRMMELEE